MESETVDHYRMLQVDPRADVEVIQAAYRVLARRFHPDHSGRDDAMKRLNAAWEVLQNIDRRAAYDRGLSSGGTDSRDATIISNAPARPVAPDHAGPPVGVPFGTVLTYGRYDGWSLGQIVLVDPGFLEWLRSVPGGRYLRPEIDALLRETAGRSSSSGDALGNQSGSKRFQGFGARIG